MSGCSSLYMSAVSTRKSQKKPLTAAQRERATARNAEQDGVASTMYPSSLGATKKTAPSVRTIRTRSSGSGSTPTLHTINSRNSRSAPLSLSSTRTGSTVSVSTATNMSAQMPAAEAGPSMSRSRSNTAPMQPVKSQTTAPAPAPPPVMPSPEPDRADLHEVEVMQMARMKLSNRDQEAMRRMRAQMVGSPDWNANNTSPVKVDERSRMPEQPIPIIPEAGPSRLPIPKSYDHTVVVLGAAGVGKTTFIERAIKSWECASPESRRLSAGVNVAVSICSVPPSSRVEQSRTIRFVELDVSHIEPESSGFWPEGLGEVSGVILCYDGTRSSTLQHFEVFLERISKQGLPMVMIACKSDPGAVLEVEAAYGNSLGEPHGTGLIEVSSETGEGRSKMRNGLRWLLYKIEQRARRQLRHLGRLQIPSVPRSPSSSQPPITHPRTSPPKSKTSSPPALPSSTYSIAQHDASSTNGTHGPRSPQKMHHRSTRTLASSIEGEGTDHRSSGSSFNWMMNGPFSPTDVSTVEGDETSVAPSKRSSLKAVVGNDGEGRPQTGVAQLWDHDHQVTSSKVNGVGATTGDVHGTGPVAEGAVPMKPDAQAPMWLSLDILFTKLFSFVVANEDDRFIASFFLTYRRFCSPLTLMTEFRTRFREVEDAPIVADAKNWALMKITGQLIDWIAEYPGDLADQATRDIYQEYQNAALQYTFMAHLTAELVHLGADLHDAKNIDFSWCISNPANTVKPRMTSGTNGTIIVNDGPILESPARDVSLSSTPADTPLDESVPDVRRPVDSDTSLVTPSTRNETTPANSVHASSGITGMNGSSAPPLPGSRIRQSSEATRSVSSSSVSLASQPAVYRHPSGSEASGTGMTAGSAGGNGLEDSRAAQWAAAFNLVADGDVRNFAVELTKMQWRVFMAIRPRDVLRHDLGKEEDDPVAFAIAFFNRLSRWVSTIILSNPKPKHRARVYERFVLIAHQLRRLNNYDSLYALISGMKETSIHRLSQTHALVSPLAPGQKEFQSHSKLMDPRGGYTLYRRALDADVDNENTAIPLLIISMINRLQSVRREDVRSDGDVQWDKFAKFGQILSVITEFQARGPMVTGEASTAFKTMINDMPILLDEDALFERSRMLEPANGQTIPPRDGRIMGLLQGKQKWADTTRYDW